MDADELLIIHQQDERWGVVQEYIKTVVESVFSHLGQEWDKAIAVVLADDATIQELNHDFRGKDQPTNVLSFPSDEEDEWGDITFAFETIEQEAKNQDKVFLDHFTHLLVHGVLHLMGYDHMQDSDAEEMEALEIAILATQSIANPYE